MTNTEYPMIWDETQTGQRESSILTVERAAYVAVGLLAAWLRFFQLGLRPLSEAEAVQALAAFRLTQGAVQAAPAGTIPALFTGNIVGFTLTGANDVTARWLPALAGLILVLLPYGLRRRLGRGGALSTSFLLAISPTAVYFSRNLDGAIVVAACGLAFVVALIGYIDTYRAGYLYVAAAALGLGVCAGPGTYTLLLIFAAFALLLYLTDRFLHGETGWLSLVLAWQAVRGEKNLLVRVGVVLIATFGLVAMAFVLHPAGVGHAADLIAAWARSFLREPAGQPAIYPLLLLFRYESLIVLLGLVEIGGLIVKRRSGGQEAARLDSDFPHTIFLLFWASAATFVILISGHRPAGGLLLVVVPMALLAGQGIERAWRWISQRSLWIAAGAVAAIALGLAVFFYLQLASYGLASGSSSVSVAGITLYASSTYLILALVELLLFVGLGAAAWIWRGADLVLAGGWLAAFVGLSLFGLKATWGLGFAHANDPRELMVLQATVPDVRLLVDRLEDLSLDQSGDAHSLPFTLDASTGPVVAWYLREFERQTVVESLFAPPDTVVAVTPAVQDLPIGDTFRGQRFPVRAHWLPWGLWGQNLVRWLLFTDGYLPIVDQEVVLWMASQS